MADGRGRFQMSGLMSYNTDKQFTYNYLILHTEYL